jgi:hypothetical protein
MKKLLLIAAIGIGFLAAAPVKAQVSLSVNIGLQPAWGPRGYDHVDYYYLPDVDAYYDVPSRNYVYIVGNSWVHRPYLPARYRGYDLYGGRKVVINSRNPWLRHNTYRTRYVTNYRRGGYDGYRGGHTTVINRHNYNRGPVNRYNNNHRDFRRGGNDHRGGDFNRGGNRRGPDHKMMSRGSGRGNDNHGNNRGGNRDHGNEGGRRGRG